MKTFYTKYFEFNDLSDALPEDFLNLFEDLLVHYNGDVSTVLDILDQYNPMYNFFNSEDDRKKLEDYLNEEGLVNTVDGRFTLSLKGKKWLEKNIFKHFFKSINFNNSGDHHNRFTGRSLNVTPENRPFINGDDFSHIDFRRSVQNAYKRNLGKRFNLHYDDLEVKDSLGSSAMATVLLVDISHSMILYGEDRITPAKKVAMALCELIRKKYPKDKLHVCVFGNDAWEIPLDSLDQISVGPFHTNTLDGIALGKKLLKKYAYMDKQIIMITDGKPTCLKEGGRYYKNPFGLDPHIISKVLKQAIDCRRQRIPITTFMLTRERQLVEFVDEFTKLNNGRAFHVNLENMSDSIIIDYLKNRKSGKR